MSSQTMQFVYDPNVLQRIIALNRNLRSRFTNLMWLWQKQQEGRTVADILAENERVIFAAGQGAWQPIKEKYRRYKVRRGFDARVLVKTGRMMRAATESGTQDNISFGDARNYYYGVNAENFRGEMGGWSYPEIHQKGQSGIRRQFIFLLNDTVTILHRFFGQSVQDEMQEIARRSQLRSLRNPTPMRHKIGRH